MMNVFRWVRGYVSVEAVGAYPERFLNLMIRKSIPMWDSKGETGKLTVKVIANRYKDLRKIAKKSNMKIKVKNKVGLPFFVLNHKDRKGLLVGSVLFLVIVTILSQFIWYVELPKLNILNEVEVRQVLKDNGLFSGSLKSSVDLKALVRNATIDLGSVGWMSVNINGTKAVVEISESYKPLKGEKEESMCNIKANKDAQIVRIETAKGQSVVNVGDAVVKGQMLISGVTTNEKGLSNIVHSKADIHAKVKYEHKIVVDMNSTVLIPTGESITREEYRFFGARVPKDIKFIPNKNYIKQISTKDFMLNNEVIPLSIFTENWIEYEKRSVKITENIALKEAEKKLALYEVFALRESEIVNKTTNKKVVDNKLIINANYECIEKIGVESKIEVE